MADAISPADVLVPVAIDLLDHLDGFGNLRRSLVLQLCSSAELSASYGAMPCSEETEVGTNQSDEL